MLYGRDRHNMIETILSRHGRSRGDWLGMGSLFTGSSYWHSVRLRHHTALEHFGILSKAAGLSL